jgi:uncharacterized membrane protein
MSRFRRARAVILPLFAISMFALFAAIGLALDGAYTAAAGRDLQAIADYSARVAADRAVAACNLAPGRVCTADPTKATSALQTVRTTWNSVPSSLDLGTATAAFETTGDGGTQVVVTLQACHEPLLLSFAVRGDRCGAGKLDVTTTGFAVVGTGH